MQMNRKKDIKKRSIMLSDKECEVIRNLIWDRIEDLDIEKDNLEDPEYGVLYHIKISLLESLAEKFDKDDSKSDDEKSNNM